MNDLVEMTLHQARKNMDIQPFVEIDNKPKHLLHMTDEDMRVKSPEELRFELDELIKEAKSKIVPVQMSLEDREKYITTKEEADRMKAELVLFEIVPRGMALLDSENITLEILRKIQDKKYEINLEYEKTRDLFEKQRVIDQYLIEHEEDNQVLHQYYDNKYKQANLMKFHKHVYNNSYDFKSVRFGFYASTLSTVLATAALGLVHPMLCGLMLYDFYLLAAFQVAFLNRTINSIILERDKRRIVVNKMNFLGYFRE